VRPLLETAPQSTSDQEIPADTFTNLSLNWDKDCDSIFSEKEQRALQIQVVYHEKKMGVSVQHLLPYINIYKCNACTANLGRHGYLLTPTTDSILPVKDTVPTPSLVTTSGINPEPILDTSTIIDQSVLASVPWTLG
jgi:hypothetical protein